MSACTGLTRGERRRTFLVDIAGFISEQLDESLDIVLFGSCEKRRLPDPTREGSRSACGARSVIPLGGNEFQGSSSREVGPLVGGGGGKRCLISLSLTR